MSVGMAMFSWQQIISAQAAVLFRRIHLVLLMTSRFLDYFRTTAMRKCLMRMRWVMSKLCVKEWELKQLMSVYKQSSVTELKGFHESVWCSVATGVTYISWETKENWDIFASQFVAQRIQHEATTVRSRHHESSQQWTKLTCSHALHAHGRKSHYQGRWEV